MDQNAPLLPAPEPAWVNLEDDADLESPTASNKHFLDQLCDAGFFKSKPVFSKRVTQNDVDVPSRRPLYAAVAINSVNNIHDHGTFQIKYRLFLLWMVDLEAADLSSLAEKARASGHWHFASDTEIEEICAKAKMPNVSIFNQVSAEKYDVQSIRVYGGHNGKSALRS
ncbi:unnamed protein product [Polarella glacialis]|uniref:Uncharacterized protein n=1 Tax=Polarella glacialis TaxID=89957 RepID=A0A813FJP7_POLGL|nr:unnamed protein product [Polarella glacialis]